LPEGSEDKPDISNVEVSSADGQTLDFKDDGDPNEVFTQTLVIVGDGGTIETHSSTITRSEQWNIRRRARDVRNSTSVDWEVNAERQNTWIPAASCAEGSQLTLWDQTNYVGNMLCLQYRRDTYFDWLTGRIEDLWTPGLNLGTVTRGAATACGNHYWYEYSKFCQCGVFGCQFATAPPITYYLYANSLKNHSGRSARFSNVAESGTGAGVTVSNGQEWPSAGPGNFQFVKSY
jgi:hypothetical protein